MATMNHVFNATTPPSSSASTRIPADSFSRIPDYLCEDLLQYLPPDQALRASKVSAQFARTVFRHHHRLVITPHTPTEWNKVKANLLKRFITDEGGVKHKIDPQAFDDLLAHFRHVDDIVILYNLDNENMDQLIGSMVKHLVKITRIHTNFFNISEPMLDQFGQVFGASLRVIKSSYLSQKETTTTGSSSSLPNSWALLKHCSNLVSLKSSELLNDQLWSGEEQEVDVTATSATPTSMSCWSTEPANSIVLPKLRDAHLNATSEEGVNQLEQFSSIYMNHLEKIKVDLVDYIYRSHHMVNYIFPLGICKFKNLRECRLTLKYNGGYDADFVWISNGLDGIAQDCPKLLHLGIDFIGHQDFFINHVLQSLRGFKSLQRLSLSVSMYNKGLILPPMASVKRLDLAYPRLYQCTHLKQLIQCYPNLVRLNLIWMYYFNDVLLNSLIGMRRMERLSVGSLCPPDVTTTGLNLFLKASPNVRTVWFDKMPKISVATLDMLVELAQERLTSASGTYYDFRFALASAEGEERASFDKYFNSKQLPKNLSIQ